MKEWVVIAPSGFIVTIEADYYQYVTHNDDPAEYVFMVSEDDDRKVASCRASGVLLVVDKVNFKGRSPL